MHPSLSAQLQVQRMLKGLPWERSQPLPKEASSRAARRERQATARSSQPRGKSKQQPASGGAQPIADSVRTEQEPSAEGTQAARPDEAPGPEEAAPAQVCGRVMRARVSRGVWWAGSTGAADSNPGTGGVVDASEGAAMEADIAEQPEGQAVQQVRSGKSKAEARDELEERAVSTSEVQGKPAKPTAAKRERLMATHATVHQEMGSGVDGAGQVDAQQKETDVQDGRPLAQMTTSKRDMQGTKADGVGHLEQLEGQKEEQVAANEAHAEAADAHLMPSTGGDHHAGCNTGVLLPSKICVYCP